MGVNVLSILKLVCVIARRKFSAMHIAKVGWACMLNVAFFFLYAFAHAEKV